jgi:hypothetical protein
MLKSALIASSLFSPSALGLTFDEAEAKIASHLERDFGSSNDVNNLGKSLCDSYTCCNITTSEACNLASMPRDESTLVLPGGETRCIYADSTPYAFQVIPGDSEKLLFYFQGGGACW